MSVLNVSFLPFSYERRSSPLLLEIFTDFYPCSPKYIVVLLNTFKTYNLIEMLSMHLKS